jgi:hypothetical protein
LLARARAVLEKDLGRSANIFEIIHRMQRLVYKWENALDEAKMRSVLYEETDAQAEEPEQVLA